MGSPAVPMRWIPPPFTHRVESQIRFGEDSPRRGEPRRCEAIPPNPQPPTPATRRQATTPAPPMTSPLARATGCNAPSATMHKMTGLHRLRLCTARRLRGRARIPCGGGDDGHSLVAACGAWIQYRSPLARDVGAGWLVPASSSAVAVNPRELAGMVRQPDREVVEICDDFQLLRHQQMIPKKSKKRREKGKRVKAKKGYSESSANRRPMKM